MSLQDWSEYSDIPLDAATYPDVSNTGFQPLRYDYTAIDQNSDLYIDADYFPQTQEATHGAKRVTHAGSPISSLSSQQSSPGLDMHAQPSQCVDSHCNGVINRRTENLDQNSSYSRNSFQVQSVDESKCYDSLMPSFQSSACSGSPSSVSPDSLQNCPTDSYSLQSMELSSSDGKSQSVIHILQELETALMGPDSDDTDLAVCGGPATSQEKDWTEIFTENSRHIRAKLPTLDDFRPRGLDQVSSENFSCMPSFDPVIMQHTGSGSRLEQLLVMCAAAIAESNLALANEMMLQLKQIVSICGSPSERLAAYMAEGLVAKVASSGQGLYNTLKCKEAPATDLLSAMQKLYEICPYFKFGYMSANGAIAEAFKDEAKVHILDFQIGHGTQWVSLIQALANRPGGPPCVRISGVNDPESVFGADKGFQTVGQRLGKLAEAVGVPLQFELVPVKMAEFQSSMVELSPGEALAVNFTLQLHHMPDESVCVTNPRDRLLRMVKAMNPKVLTLVEQEANTNTAPFLPRFLEAWKYYLAIFDSIDVALPRDSKDRVNVEQQCLARDIVNIIACEGAERVERHELTGKWRARMMMAGFKPHPLSSHVNNTIKTLLGMYCENYRLKEEGGALFLGWLNRPLVVASAWQ